MKRNIKEQSHHQLHFHFIVNLAHYLEFIKDQDWHTFLNYVDSQFNYTGSQLAVLCEAWLEARGEEAEHIIMEGVAA